MATSTVRWREQGGGIPWYLWCVALAVTSVTIGAHWDVSWHRSIGRDTFWTPAHMAIYLCGVLAGIACGYLILTTTWRAVRGGAAEQGPTDEMVASSVRIFGLRGPLGAFLAAWGGIAMLTSAPFDNWWHAAYGLDVKIVSPPHSLLMLGIWAVAVGALFLTLAAMNRAGTAEGGVARQRHLQALMLYVGGMMLVLSMFFRMEYTWDVKLHQSGAYMAVALGVPTFLAMMWAASRNRWASSWMTAIYTVFVAGLVWILPLFAAVPKLGPVYQQVTHFIPPKFPLLLLVPALAMDLLWHSTEKWKPWLVALISGPVFILTFVVVQWPFASFLMTKGAENWFFGAAYHDYGTPSTSFEVLRQFWMPESGAALWRGLGWAMVAAAVSTWMGLALGRWMRSIQR